MSTAQQRQCLSFDKKFGSTETATKMRPEGIIAKGMDSKLSRFGAVSESYVGRLP